MDQLKQVRKSQVSIRMRYYFAVMGGFAVPVGWLLFFLKPSQLSLLSLVSSTCCTGIALILSNRPTATSDQKEEST